MFIINPFYDHTTLSRCKVNHYFPFHQTFPHFFHQSSIVTNNLPFAQPRPRRTNNRTSCVKYSQFYCVDNHEQPFRGEFSCQREHSIKLA